MAGVIEQIDKPQFPSYSRMKLSRSIISENTWSSLCDCLYALWPQNAANDKFQ